MNDSEKVEKTRAILIQALAQDDPEKTKDQIEEALCLLDDEDYEEFKRSYRFLASAEQQNRIMRRVQGRIKGESKE